MNEKNNYPLLILEFEKSTGKESLYRIYPEESGKPVQSLVFDTEDYSITFCGGPSPLKEYLQKNEKWLRSILYTSLRAEDPQEIRLPVCFPEKSPDRAVPEDHIKCYSDGSCDSSGNAGWGALVIDKDGTIHELSGSERGSTSNRAELTAAVRAVEKAMSLAGTGMPLLLLTDSMYVVKGINHRLQVWRKNGYITAYGKEVLNRDLWAELGQMLDSSSIYCRWTESGGHEYNRRCDFLAGMESKTLAQQITD